MLWSKSVGIPAISLFSEWLVLADRNCPLTFSCADSSVRLAPAAI